MPTTTPRVVNLNIIPAPHSKAQYDLMFDPQSSVNLMGRRIGKTTGGCGRMLNFGVHDPGIYWWVGLSWRAASMKRAWRLMKYFTRRVWLELGKDPKPYIREAAHELVWPNKLIYAFRSAEAPESLAGEGVKGIVGDEFTLWDENVWSEYLEAATLDYSAWVCLLGIPKGESNWGCRLFKSVQAGEREGWIARQHSTEDNPYLFKDWVPKFKRFMRNDKKTRAFETIRKNTPTWLFDQEYRAQIIEGVGTPFTRESVYACRIKERYQLAAHHEIRYVAGVDPAGGGADEFTMAIFHKDTKGKLVQDFLFAELATNPSLLVKRICDILKLYNIRRVIGDAYSGSWVRTEFMKHGIDYTLAIHTASDAYINFEPLIKQGNVELLDDMMMMDQLVSLVGRESTTGEHKIIHTSSAHDDRANVTALCALAARDLPACGVSIYSSTNAVAGTRTFSPPTTNRLSSLRGSWDRDAHRDYNK